MRTFIIVGNILFLLAWPLGGFLARMLSQSQDAAGGGYAVVMGYALAFSIFNPFIALWPLLNNARRERASSAFTFLAFFPTLLSSLAVILAIGWIVISLLG